MNENIEQTNEKPNSETVKPEEPTTKTKKAQDKTVPKKRQIVIETDGNLVNLVQADVAGVIELEGILQTLITFIKSKK